MANNEITVAQARTTIRQAFESDPDFKRVYRDNIAMLLRDKNVIVNLNDFNGIAEDIINLIFFS